MFNLDLLSHKLLNTQAISNFSLSLSLSREREREREYCNISSIVWLLLTIWTSQIIAEFPFVVVVLRMYVRMSVSKWITTTTITTVLLTTIPYRCLLAIRISCKITKILEYLLFVPRYKKSYAQISNPINTINFHWYCTNLKLNYHLLYAHLNP